jgi:6-phosphogluconolactonase (cycloisomerase 2 family)
MEIKRRMQKKFGWLLGLGALVLVGALVACGTTYNSSTDGLVLVGNQGSYLVQTFTFSLTSGHMATAANSTSSTVALTCVLPGAPGNLVVNPAGTFAYSILTAEPAVCPTGANNVSAATGIEILSISSDGNITATGPPLVLNKASVGVCQTQGNQTQPVMETLSVVPIYMAVDTAGKYLFVADNGTTDLSGLSAPGAISVLAINSDGTLTEVPGSPFTTPATCTGLPNNFVSVAPSPTIFPASLNGLVVAACTNQPPPTAEYLYAVDQANYLVWQFVVNTSTGALSSNSSTPLTFPTDPVPAGVAVDPCNRFVYVSGSQNNRVNAYQICTSIQATQCQNIPNGGLIDVPGQPYTMSGGANGPGPMVVDPYGNSLYVLDTRSNQVSTFHISPVAGTLTPGSPAVVATGLGPTALTIRSDDNWLFVSNYQAASVSQYGITPLTGALSPLPVTTTDNYPSGIAVK